MYAQTSSEVTSLQESAADVTNSLVMKTFAELERTSFSKKQSAVYAKSNLVKRTLEDKRALEDFAAAAAAKRRCSSRALRGRVFASLCSLCSSV